MLRYYLKKIISYFLSLMGYSLVRSSNFHRLLLNQRSFKDYILSFWLLEEGSIIKKNALNISKSQIFQDIFVLNETNFKKGGYFVEFGATDGVRFSNTFMLEKEFDWTGILSEPAQCWHKDLQKNRDALIDHSCIWSKSYEKILFTEYPDTNGLSAERSSIAKFDRMKYIFPNSRNSKKYIVETLSLRDLLQKYDAPRKIDYLSIDTEGSEYEILKNFNFDEYDIRIITCEHNFSNNRELLYNLLIANGYVRKFSEYSQFDDWYVKA